MTDVFFCSAPRSLEREEMAQRCLKAWLSIHNLWVRYSTPETSYCRRETFNRERRINAEQEAKGPVYILTDDDMLPQGDAFVKRGLDVMAGHPDFAILSAWPEPATIHPWTSEGYTPYEDYEVMEHVSVGGLRFCRKGALTKWPSADGPGYDMEHCIALRATGHRVGYMKHVRALHLGEGKSELWKIPLDTPSPVVPVLTS